MASPFSPSFNAAFGNTAISSNPASGGQILRIAARGTMSSGAGAAGFLALRIVARGSINNGVSAKTLAALAANNIAIAQQYLAQLQKLLP